MLIIMVCSNVDYCEAKKHVMLDEFDVMEDANRDDHDLTVTSVDDKLLSNGDSRYKVRRMRVKNRRKEKKIRSKLDKEELRRIKEQELVLLSEKIGSTDVECHKTAVGKCGHTFIRALKFLDYIESTESFRSRCALRKAFFSCLHTWKNRMSCDRSGVNHSEKFRKRLANTLWSTRTCLLGFKS